MSERLKDPSQPHLCFSLHARIWLLYFIRSLSKRREITVKLLKIRLRFIYVSVNVAIFNVRSWKAIPVESIVNTVRSQQIEIQLES